MRLLNLKSVVLFAISGVIQQHANLWAEPLRDPDPESVNAVLKKMTVEEKVGQLFMIGFTPKSASNLSVLSPSATKLIKEFKIGSVILFEENIPATRPFYPGMENWGPDEVVSQTIEVTRALQDSVPPLDRDSAVRLPLFIAVDQENGSASVIEGGVTALPGALSIGQTRSEKHAYDAGRITGVELRALGINMNLAPVLDVDTNTGVDYINDRSFGGDPTLVAHLGTAFGLGLVEGGVVPIGKHFAGHGESSTNPDDANVKPVERGLNTLRQFNFPPFQTFSDHIGTGLMSTHIEFKALTSDRRPLSLSRFLRPVVSEYVSGFSGLILSDDLSTSKGALQAADDDVGKAVLMALTGGTDIVLLARVERALGSIDSFGPLFAEAVEFFEDNPADLNERVARVLTAKSRVGPLSLSQDWMPVFDARQVVGSLPHREAAKRIADDSIVVLSCQGQPADDLQRCKDFFPLRNSPLGSRPASDELFVVSPVYLPPDEFISAMRANIDHDVVGTLSVSYFWSNDRLFRSIWEKHDTTVFNPMKESERNSILREVRHGAQLADVLIIGIVDREQSGVLDEVIAEMDAGTIDTKPIIAISFREPYVFSENALRSEHVLALNVGSKVEPSIESLIDVLYGNVMPKGLTYVTSSVLPDSWVDRDRVFGPDIIPDDRLELTRTHQDPFDPLSWSLKWFLGPFVAPLLISFAFGIVGALATMVVKGTLPRHAWLKWSRKQKIRPGWALTASVEAVFGMAVFALFYSIDVPTDTTELSKPLAMLIELLSLVDQRSFLVAGAVGFIFGTQGHRLIAKLPMIEPTGGESS